MSPAANKIASPVASHTCASGKILRQSKNKKAAHYVLNFVLNYILSVQVCDATKLIPAIKAGTTKNKLNLSYNIEMS
jgi:hypothetical protein